MSEHLTRATEYLTTVGPVSTDPNDIPKLTAAMWHLVNHLEAQQETPASAGSSPTTAKVTTDKRWGVAGSILQETLESWLSGQQTTESLVGLLFAYAAQWDALPGDEQILALAAEARTSISQSVGSKSSAAVASSAASHGVSAPDSPASSPEPAQGGRDWRDFDMRNPEKSY